MVIVLAVVCIVVLLAWIVIQVRRTSAKRDIDQHSITAEELRALLDTNREVLLFDVRQPLDLLARTEIIPGAKRIPPKEVMENPTLIPRDKDSIVYCTCPSDETSLTVLQKARAARNERVKVLKGGLEAWKAKGYPVVPYTEVFHL